MELDQVSFAGLEETDRYLQAIEQAYGEEAASSVFHKEAGSPCSVTLSRDQQELWEALAVIQEQSNTTKFLPEVISLGKPGAQKASLYYKRSPMLLDRENLAGVHHTLGLDAAMEVQRLETILAESGVIPTESREARAAFDLVFRVTDPGLGKGKIALELDPKKLAAFQIDPAASPMVREEKQPANTLRLPWVDEEALRDAQPEEVADALCRCDHLQNLGHRAVILDVPANWTKSFTGRLLRSARSSLDQNFQALRPSTFDRIAREKELRFPAKLIDSNIIVPFSEGQQFGSDRSLRLICELNLLLYLKEKRRGGGVILVVGRPEKFDGRLRFMKQRITNGHLLTQSAIANTMAKQLAA